MENSFEGTELQQNTKESRTAKGEERLVKLNQSIDNAKKSVSNWFGKITKRVGGWMHGAKVAFEINSMSLFRIRLRRPK